MVQGFLGCGYFSGFRAFFGFRLGFLGFIFLGVRGFRVFGFLGYRAFLLLRFFVTV